MAARGACTTARADAAHRVLLPAAADDSEFQAWAGAFLHRGGSRSDADTGFRAPIKPHFTLIRLRKTLALPPMRLRKLDVLLGGLPQKISLASTHCRHRGQHGTTVVTTRCTKGGGKLDVGRRMPGAGLSRWRSGKAPLGKPAFQPYWGTPAVRNDREDRGKRRHHSKPDPRLDPTRLHNGTHRRCWPSANISAVGGRQAAPKRWWVFSDWPMLLKNDFEG